MPRQARLILDNACYHVVTRGNEKRKIFLEKDDCQTYIKLLARYKEKWNCNVYGWCLMPNHVHLIVECTALSKFMHGLNLSYVYHFKNKYDSIGHLWQDRFKSFVMQKDQYLINCISYIEYNPVRAKMASRPEDYEWSSYRIRILGEKSKLLDTKFI